MKRFSLAALAIAAAGSVGAETVTLQDAVRRAAEANPAIIRAQAGVDAAAAQRRLARSAILPRIELDASAKRNENEVVFPFPALASIQPRNDWRSEITLRQTLYAGGRELKVIRQTALAIDAAKHGHRSAEEAILFRTAADYLALVEADALIEVERQNVEVASRRRNDAAERLRVGEGTRVEILRAEAAQKAAERALAAATQRRHEAVSRLQLDLNTDDPIDAITPAIAFPAIPSSAELTARAMASHPEVRRASVSLDIARFETRRQRGGYLPTVTAMASMSRQRAGFPSSEARSVSVYLHLPIFDSGETAARIAMAHEREKQIGAAADETRHEIREEVERALVALETARRTKDLASEQLNAARGEYEQITALYRAEEATSLDLHIAEAALADARRIATSAALQVQLAELRVWFAAGSLKSILLN